MTLDRERLIAEIARLAERAGARILELYAAGVTVERKADRSPVTEADRASEAIILPALAALAPEISIVSEEAIASGDRPKVGARFWLVDPLDGTREFVNRIGEFTVNIALVEDGMPTLGVVHLPASGETYTGRGPGTAMRRQRGGGDRPIATRIAPAEGLTVLVSRSHGDRDRHQTFLEAWTRDHGQTIKASRPAGSALKFCLIAAGEADLYPRIGPTMEWDTAAGQAVLVSAGGRVETLDGAPLRYRKPDFRNGDFVARGR